MAFSMQEILSFYLMLTGLPFFVREVFASNRVTIINYHDPDPDPDVFEILCFHASIFLSLRYKITLIPHQCKSDARDFSTHSNIRCS